MKLITILLFVHCFLVSSLQAAPKVIIREVAEVTFPAHTDSNSPCHWDGDTFYLFNSSNHPSISSGTDQFNLGEATKVDLDDAAGVEGGRWLEATWKSKDGTLYGWYHNEPPGICPGSEKEFQYGLTAPRIGALKSTEQGRSWTDLGIILEAPVGTVDCTSKNGYFAGGNGDFSVMLDSNEEYLYFFFGTYAGDLSQQGVSVARMRWSDRDQPKGKVWKYFKNQWSEPGINGNISPIFAAQKSWKGPDTDAFWGPSIHWNTHLGLHVILLNRSCCKPGWPQEGVYVSFSSNLADPQSWTVPEKILEGGGWYPQVIGINADAKETDKLCGKQARLYMFGRSKREILFLKETEDSTSLPPVYEPKQRTR